MSWLPHKICLFVGIIFELVLIYAWMVLTLVRMYPSKVGYTLVFAAQGTNTNKLEEVS